MHFNRIFNPSEKLYFNLLNSRWLLQYRDGREEFEASFPQHECLLGRGHITHGNYNSWTLFNIYVYLYKSWLKHYTIIISSIFSWQFFTEPNHFYLFFIHLARPVVSVEESVPASVGVAREPQEDPGRAVCQV